MAEIINRGKELIRINPTKRNQIQYSTNDGRSWQNRHSASLFRDFTDLTDNGKEILATTEKGLYFSRNDGRSWQRRG